jgi:hypothetical protein
MTPLAENSEAVSFSEREHVPDIKRDRLLNSLDFNNIWSDLGSAKNSLFKADSVMAILAVVYCPKGTKSKQIALA